MKISRLCLLVLLSLLCTGLAFADGINDPKIIIHGVSGGGAPGFARCPPSGCTNVGMNFTFSTPADGSGNLFFTNASGKNWTSLKLIEKGVPAADISCAQSMFLSCTVRTLGDGSVEILLAGVKGHNPRNGIPNGSSFLIGFKCVGESCWPGGLNFSGHAGAAPEPGTIALVATGIGAIVSRRKRWKKSLKA
ncbi:MAG: PEP-CTERM sorting domain-containing protein [Terriglobales bacterium]